MSESVDSGVVQLAGERRYLPPEGVLVPNSMASTISSEFRVRTGVRGGVLPEPNGGLGKFDILQCPVAEGLEVRCVE